jgi:hypothetical protein
MNKLKYEILKESNLIDNKTLLLMEGIRFFKNSIRLKKLSNKVKKQIRLTDDETTRIGLNEFIKKIDDIAAKFEEVEDQYASGDKENAKQNYKVMVAANADLIKEINKESIKKALIAAGIASLIFGIFGAMFGGNVSTTQVATSGNTQFAPVANVEQLKKNVQTAEKEIARNNKMIELSKSGIEAQKAYERNSELLKTINKELEQLNKLK